MKLLQRISNCVTRPRLRFACMTVYAALIFHTGTTWSDETPNRMTFERDVMSVLSKAGCNSGTCHGNINGKGGFFLSLRGQDADFDYKQIVQMDSGRRVNQIVPEKSLLLLKATAAVPHGGGRRFATDEPEYEILTKWISEGTAAVNPDAPQVSKLVATPEDAVIWSPENSQPLNVIAQFSDGTQRDVTRLACFETSDPLVEVTPEGVVQFSDPGVVTVVIRYLNQQTPVRIAYRPAVDNFVWQGPEPQNFIDEVIFKRLQQLKIQPAPLADDGVFLRRIFLDLLGVLPTEEEAKRFVLDSSPAKREKLIDEILQRPEFAAMWALKWSDVVRNEEKQLDATGVEKLHAWIRESFEQDKPLNQFAKELIEARGSTYENPPANYWRAHREPFVRAETTAQVFLGIRLQCAKCHNHPFDRWSQDEYYEWASLFSGIDYEIVKNERRDKLDKHEFVGEQIVKVSAEGSVKNARTGKQAPPHFLGSDQKVEGDRLNQLGAWISDPDNSMFAAAQVNRIWYHVMGSGLVDPVDDLRSTNPASHPELFTRLVDEFKANEFRLKPLVKASVLSHTYQLASDPGSERQGGQESPEQVYAQAVVRRLTAEQILDAQSQVLGLPAKFKGYPSGTRAGEIAGVERVRRSLDDGDQFLRLFGKPERLLACECERSDEATLGQALSLIGGESLNQRIERSNNRIGKLLASGEDHQQVIESLFWTALTRPPSKDEMQRTLSLIEQTQNPRLVLEDLTWALLNSKELLFRN